MIPQTLSQTDIEHLPNYRRKTTAGEYSSTCPWCGGQDRFLFWPDKGNYYCRQCEANGFVIDAPGDNLWITPEQREIWKRAEQRRKEAERQQQLTLAERMARSPNAELYHRQMTDRSYWYSQGLNDETINRFRLGYCPACPTYPDSPSWTIPIYYRNRLYNIRHRLVNPGDSGKYRPEMAGLPGAIFAADILDEPEWMTVIVEGEVKTMVLNQNGLSTVGIPGANSFKEKWLKLFEKCHNIYIALDPGADDQARRIGAMLAGIGINTYVCTLPVKPDDFIVIYNGTARELFLFLMLGQKIKAMTA